MRDFATGFHSNDAESEIARVNRFCRCRHSGVLTLSKRFMDEYTFYVNRGNSIDVIMDGLATSNGGTTCVRKVVQMYLVQAVG